MKQQVAVKLFGKEWQILVSRNMSFWHQYLSGVSHANQSGQFGVKIGLEMVSVSENGTRTHVFGYPENITAYSKAVLQAFATPAKVQAMKKRYETFARQLLRSTEKAVQQKSVRSWKIFIKEYAHYTIGLTITTVLGREGQIRLHALLEKKGFSEQKITGLIGSITYPQQHTPLMQSQLDLLAIGARVQNQKISVFRQTALLQGWLKKHQYIPVNFCDEPWTLTDAQKQLQKLLESNCSKRLQELNKAHAAKKNLAKKTLRKLKTAAIGSLAYALAEGTFLNEYRKNVFSRVSLLYRPLFAEIAQRGGSSNWRDCFSLTPDEMTKLLEGKKLDVARIVKDRAVVGVAALYGKPPQFLTRFDAERFLAATASGKTEATQERTTTLQGFAASRGYIKGIAKVVLDSNDFSKLKPKEILVTRMTSVDFIPVMERAGAFITDEGGITSHASIVAREMNKPCIIGTKNATKVLHDGDLVEVDAEKGIVRKLN